MNHEPVLLDTSYIQALLNRRDQYHSQARRIVARLSRAARLWITEAVLVEVGNALSGIDRSAAEQFIRGCYEGAETEVVSVTTDLLLRALALYAARPDKAWGLTDCISFVVMEENGIRLAATADSHFVQAGFRALMLEPSE